MHLKLNKNHQRGQGMTEYIIIVALIAIAAIAVMTKFGSAIKFQVGESIAGFTETKNAIEKPEVTEAEVSARKMGDFAKMSKGH